MPLNPQTIIKVIGVGGGGGNAVSNMFKTGITDVSFVLCNTDNQALKASDVPTKLLLGRNTTFGLGSGDSLKKGNKRLKKAKMKSDRCSAMVLV